MTLRPEELSELTEAGIIDQSTADRIKVFFDETGRRSPVIMDFTHGAYLLGSVVVICAMAWFMSESFNRFGAFILSVTAIGYAVVFGLAANTLWKNPKLKLPGGILFTLATVMVPLAVFGLLSGLDLWPVMTADNRAEFLTDIRFPRLIVESSAVLAVLVMMHFRPFALLALPMAYALWGMSIDLAVLISAPPGGFLPEWVNFEISFVFGLAVIAVAYLIDRRTEADYSAWLYLSGLLPSWGTITLYGLGTWVYPVLALLSMAAGILLVRTSFMAIGILGILAYLGYLAGVVFEDSVVFPLALVAIGVGIITAGVWYRNHREDIEARFLSAIPPTLRNTLPRYR